MTDIPAGFELEEAAAPTSASGPFRSPLPPGFEVEAAPQQSANRSVLDQLIGAGGPRYQLFPERIARDIYSRAQNAFTAPGEAYQHGLTPEQETAAGVNTFLTLNPANPMVASGDRIIPGVARAALPQFESKTAAETAQSLGAPLPIGLASDNRAVQAVTQAARQLPVVGQKIDTRTGETIGAAGQSVQDLADELGGGITDRAATGAILRPSLKGVVEANNSRVDDAFSSLRGMIDQSEPVGELPRTEAVLREIVKQRSAAGQRNPFAGLEDVKNLVDQGATFDGLQRARSDIGNSLQFGEANPGFNAGDLKRVYGAMSADMDHVVRQSVHPGVAPEAAAQALTKANQTATPLFEFNKSLQRLMNIRNDEGVVGSVVRSAQDKTGNVKLLAQLRATMPAEDFQQVAGTALSELGHNPATGKFSLNQFATQWEKMSDRAKGVLFSQQHKQHLDNIAQLGRQLKDADRYANTSNTGRAVMVGTMATALVHSGLHALSGNVMPFLYELGSLGGGYGLATMLSRPAGAASMAQWSRTVMGQSMAPSPARAAAVTAATRNLITNFADAVKLPVSQVLKQIRPPSAQEPSEPSLRSPEVNRNLKGPMQATPQPYKQKRNGPIGQ